MVFEINTPITRGQQVIIFSFSARIPAKIVKLEAVINSKTGETIKAYPKCLVKNQSAVIRI